MDSQILGAAIKDFNAKQNAKNRATVEERSCIMMLHSQTDSFREMLGRHWQSFPVSHSAVPVTLLAKPFLTDTFDPPVKKASYPRMYQALMSSPEKREMWLNKAIGKYLRGLKEPCVGTWSTHHHKDIVHPSSEF